MATALCADETPSCLGLDQADGDCPTAPVYCVNGILGAQFWTAAKGYMAGAGETVNVPISTASVYNSSELALAMVNPYCQQAIVHVSHEFGITALISDTDQWSFNGDFNISGGTRFDNGLTTGQFNLQGRDGTAYANDNTLVQVDGQHTYEMYYVVGAGGAFTVTQLARFEAIDIRGSGRVYVGNTNAMKVLIMPQQF